MTAVSPRELTRCGSARRLQRRGLQRSRGTFDPVRRLLCDARHDTEPLRCGGGYRITGASDATIASLAERDVVYLLVFSSDGFRTGAKNYSGDGRRAKGVLINPHEPVVQPRLQ